MHSIHHIESYDIAGKGLPDDVEKKVRLIHRPMLERVQGAIGIALGISMKSAYRSVEWERAKGRSGKGEHTFIGFGAVDVTCADFSKNKSLLLQGLMEHSLYTRIAVYNSFIHCDLKNPLTDRWVYDSNWRRKSKI
jgi:hypothetical protein